MPVTPRFLKGFNLKEVRVLTYLSLLLPALCGIFTMNRLAVTCNNGMFVFGFHVCFTVVHYSFLFFLHSDNVVLQKSILTWTERMSPYHTKHVLS